MEIMETEVKKIPVNSTTNLGEKIKSECSEMNNTSYVLVSSFILDGSLFLIFQRQI